MKELSILKQMEQTLQSLLCRPDGRVKDHPLEFVTNLLLSFQHDSRQASLESLRRMMKERL